MTTQAAAVPNPTSLIACWSAKGGVGTSVVSAVLALALSRHHPTVLVDTGGDQAAVFGTEAPDVGFEQWISGGPDVPVDALERLAVPVTPTLRLVPTGREAKANRGFNEAMTRRIRSAFPDSHIVVDVGVVRGSEDRYASLVSDADLSLIVLRPCYLGAQRALANSLRRDGIIFVEEPGRVLRDDDMRNVLSTEIVAALDVDSSLARLIDAGRLTKRLPRSVKPLEQLAYKISMNETKRAK